MAQLDYTHADAMWYSEFWQREEGWLGPIVFLNRDLVGAQYSDVERAFTDAAVWFREEGGATGFDGGGIHFTFSGHGREDGALILENDTAFSPRDLVSMALAAHEASGSARQTKLVVYLDSCHSGAFILDLMEIVMRECSEELGVFRATASCYPDELSYEVPELGHGLATYSHSMRPRSMGSLTVDAGLQRIRTWGIIQGPGGCSLVTMGKQNPIQIGNYGELEACNRQMSLYGNNEDWEPKPREQWEAELFAARAEFLSGVDLVYGRSANEPKQAGLEQHLESLISLGSSSLSRSILDVIRDGDWSEDDLRYGRRGPSA